MVKNYECSIVIIGGGTSGIAAAAMAAEKGESVIVMEKMGICGGCANMAAGVMAYESRLQKEAQETKTAEEAFQEHMEYTHYSADASLSRKFFAESADIIRWLESIGVEFVGVYKSYPKGERTWHIVKAPGTNKPADRSASGMMKLITEAATDRGVQVLFNTTAKELLFEDGYAVGVKGTDNSGNEVTVMADAVIVATNGFQSDSPMGKELLGSRWVGDDAYSVHSIPGLTGDGLRMLRDAGCSMVEPGMTFESAIPGVADKYPTIQTAMTQYDLIVDLSGHRVMNEEQRQNPEYFGRQLLLAPNRTLYTIINDEILNGYRENGIDNYNPIHSTASLHKWDEELESYKEDQSLFEEEDPEFAEFFEEVNMEPGGLSLCETLEEVSEKTGINLDDLKETISAYNSCAFGCDPDFGKSPRYMKPLLTGPYYVAAHKISSLESRGGVRTDDRMRCLREDCTPIGGLYCIGTDANNIMGNMISMHRIFGASICFAFVSAKLAVNDILRYLDEEFS